MSGQHPRQPVRLARHLQLGLDRRRLTQRALATGCCRMPASMASNAAGKGSHSSVGARYCRASSSSQARSRAAQSGQSSQGGNADGQRQGQFVGGKGAQHGLNGMGFNHGLAPLVPSIFVMPV